MNGTLITLEELGLDLNNVLEPYACSTALLVPRVCVNFALRVISQRLYLFG